MPGLTSRLLYGILATGLIAGLALWSLPDRALAEKVGVAAHVKPDAFSGGEQMRIGNSVFYNQRINTDSAGLVQVLLVDGSTFTVGPSSDLIIDKFVYDPRKQTGEVVATFGKGVMRFVGGKISKNEGGVTVKTPEGALAIRGGMVQGSIGGGESLFSFLYGISMKFTGTNGQTHNVFEPGYTLDFSGGLPKIRKTTPEDVAFFMKALSGGGFALGGGDTNINQTNNLTEQTYNQVSNQANEIVNNFARLRTRWLYRRHV